MARTMTPSYCLKRVALDRMACLQVPEDHMNERLGLGWQIDGLLDRLYARHVAQNDALETYFRARAAEGSLDWNQFDERTNEFLKDKLIALDRSKAEFCYHVCRALRARRIVEAGTSFGVSTLFLAAAVRDNLRQETRSQDGTRQSGVVIGTEHEPEKAKMARRHFVEAGLADLIDLRAGDLRETLVDVEGLLHPRAFRVDHLRGGR